MIKQFRLTVELEVEVGESVDRGVKRKRMIEELVRRFLANDEVVTRLYRLWLYEDLKHGDWWASLRKFFKKESDNEILIPAIEACSKQTRDHFLKVLEADEKETDPRGQVDLEAFFNLLGGIEVRGAAFELVVGEGTDG